MSESNIFGYENQISILNFMTMIVFTCYRMFYIYIHGYFDSIKHNCNYIHENYSICNCKFSADKATLAAH